VSSWKYLSTTHLGRIDLMRSFLEFCIGRQSRRPPGCRSPEAKVFLVKPYAEVGYRQ
jgi:hypothetical protein